MVANDAIARTGMVIRRPSAEVWEALVEPAVTSRFWYSHGEGRLDAPGSRAIWHWSWYGFQAVAVAVEMTPMLRLVYDWGAPQEQATRVECTLSPRDDATYLEIAISGFAGDPAAQLAAAADSAGGFSFMLAGMKAWLEHGLVLDLVADRFPR